MFDGVDISVKELRKNAKLMTRRKYNITIGLVLLYGFIVNVLMCHFFSDVFMSWNFTAIIIGYFILCFTGIMMSTCSDNPAISFIGYNLVVVPVGVVLSIALIEYDNISIMNALYVTTGVTLVMIVIATAFPKVFLSMGQVLFYSLLAVVAIEIIGNLIGIIRPSWWDIAIAALFCLYVGYDWAKAQEEELTLDNAIDAVVGLYLDIINIFVRILSASGRSSSSRK